MGGGSFSVNNYMPSNNLQFQPDPNAMNQGSNSQGGNTPSKNCESL